MGKLWERMGFSKTKEKHLDVPVLLCLRNHDISNINQLLNRSLGEKM